MSETLFLEPRGSLEFNTDSDHDALLAEESPNIFWKRWKVRLGVAAVLLIVVTCMFGVGFGIGFGTGYVTGKHNSQSDTVSPSPAPSFADELCANPPVILISLDGFWNGYFERNVTEFISSLGSEGVKAEYMRSAYPTKTFPNHYTIVTGLYPESHGIVSNYFHDKLLGDDFSIGNNDPKWWKGEPVWVTAAKQGLKTGTYFWPGSEVPFQGMYPTYYLEYDNSIQFDQRVDTVLGWLDQPTGIRPQFITLYFNEPDHSGHAAGPNSLQVDAALGRVDEVVESLYLGLKERDIQDCVNMLIVSDHGMTAYDPAKLFRINSFVPEEYNATYIRGVNMDINVNEGDKETVRIVYDIIQNITDAPFQTYYLEDIPLRLHIGHYNTERYGDIHLVGDIGSYITDRNSRPPLGEHGYHNNHVDMQAIFVAHGPAFKEGYLAPAFDNIQVYNLICALLNITPSINNGTFGALHHMLKPKVVDTLPPVAVRKGDSGVLNECPLPEHGSGLCSNCACPDHCQAGQSDELNIPTSDKAQFQKLHLPWGVPVGGEGNGSCLLINKDSVILYSNVLHIPLWVAYTLTKESAVATNERQCFLKDPRTPTVNCSYYRTEGTNYTLQSLSPSTVVWNEWDRLVRNWAVTHGDIHVIVGSVMDSNKNGIKDIDEDYDRWLLGVGNMAIPSHFFGVVIRCAITGSSDLCPPSSLDVLGVLLPNLLELPYHATNSSEFIQFHLSTLLDIEQVTGVNFFPELSAEDQAKLKLQITQKVET